MPNRTYKLEEIVGVSGTSTDDAIQDALLQHAGQITGPVWRRRR